MFRARPPKLWKPSIGGNVVPEVLPERNGRRRDICRRSVPALVPDALRDYLGASLASRCEILKRRSPAVSPTRSHSSKSLIQPAEPSFAERSIAVQRSLEAGAQRNASSSAAAARFERSDAGAGAAAAANSAMYVRRRGDHCTSIARCDPPSRLARCGSVVLRCMVEGMFVDPVASIRRCPIWIWRHGRTARSSRVRRTLRQKSDDCFCCA